MICRVSINVIWRECRKDDEPPGEKHMSLRLSKKVVMKGRALSRAVDGVICQRRRLSGDVRIV